jgi:protein subunit release factor B
MTQQAVDILNRWIAETVHAVAPEEAEKEAARLVAEFTAYAEDAGLNTEELEVDLGQDLLATMKEALLAASGTETGDLLADEE